MNTVKVSAVQSYLLSLEKKIFFQWLIVWANVKNTRLQNRQKLEDMPLDKKDVIIVKFL